ncbi:MAG: YcaO-like family protein [Nitrospirae bacterium YQR-1]
MSSLNSSSINYRGVLYSLPKEHKNGFYRSFSPEETLKRINPYFKAIGLTRLSDITGLDRIGIPVIASFRPNAKTITTSAGKGITTEAAMASAAMESIEIFHAENINIPIITSSYKKLKDRYNAIEINGLALTKNSIFNINKPEKWILGWDIVNECEVAVPLLQVSLDYAYGLSGLTISFQMGSNGLASGNHFLEALCSALFEIIERDAIACISAANTKSNYPLKIIDPKSIGFDSVRKLIGRFESAHIRPVIFDYTVDTDVPVFVTYIYDLKFRHMGVYKGAGAHLDPEIALLRSLTEAAQSRLLVIAGSRDEIFRHIFSAIKTYDNSANIRFFKNPCQTMSTLDKSNESTDTIEGDIQLCIKNLKLAGLNRIIVFDITRPDMEISVVRVVVPGAEGYMFRHYTPGYRAMNFACKEGV